MIRPAYSTLLIALLTVAAAAARGQAQTPTGKIVQYGRYTAAVIGAVPTTDDVSGGVHIISTQAEHSRTTQKIPCAIGERFGFTVRLDGLETGREYKLRSITVHPPIKQPDGRILKKSVSEQSVTAPGPTAFLVDCWAFAEGYEYELVPGPWTRTVYLDGKSIAEMTFEVIDGVIVNDEDEPEED